MSRVLVAEDEPMIGRILAEKLTREGHVVTRAATVAGLRAGAVACDVALVDATLDEDGIDAMRELAALGGAPVEGWFALVEARCTGDGERAIAAGAAGVIRKPFKPTAVAAQVAALTSLPR